MEQTKFYELKRFDKPEEINLVFRDYDDTDDPLQKDLNEIKSILDTINVGPINGLS